MLFLSKVARRSIIGMEGSGAQLLRKARASEGRKVQKLQQARRTTNPYHKEQYIAAFIEARSVAMSESLATDTLDSRHLLRVEPTSCDRPSELCALADELEARHGANCLPESSTALTTSSGSQRCTPVGFGDWRKADAEVARELRRAECVFHCVVREARTPPSLSPEALALQLPLDSPALKSFSAYINALAGIETVATDAASRLHRSYLRLVRRVVGRAERNWSASDATLASALSCYVTVRVTERLGCQVALQFVLAQLRSGAHHHHHHYNRSGMPSRASTVSRQVAVLAEAVRAQALRSSDVGPTLRELEELCVTANAAIRQGNLSEKMEGGKSRSTSQRTSPDEGNQQSQLLLQPVVAAPLLSLIHPGRDGSPAVSSADVQAFAERFLIHVNTRSGLRYMPALAWGELLLAHHRCEASHVALQELTDAITDPTITANADALVRDVHIWNAYLASSPCEHALEIFENNRKHYGLRPTAATTASLMHALLQDLEAPDATARARKALGLWRSLLSRSTSEGDTPLVPGTCSTMVELTRAYAALRDLRSLLHLCVDHSALLLHFGVPYSWWEASQGPALMRQVEAGAALCELSQSCAHFFHIACEAHAGKVPVEVQCVLVKAVESTCAAVMAPPEAVEVPELSAEALAKML